MTDNDKSTDAKMTTEMKKNDYKELCLQQKEHIRLLMERLEMKEDLYSEKQKRLEEAEEELKKTKEELAELKDTEKHVIIPAYWYVDEETNEKVYDTDEMESVFHDAMVDLGAYNDELRCEGCDKQFGVKESSFQNAEGLAVCVDCLKGEESGEE